MPEIMYTIQLAHQALAKRRLDTVLKWICCQVVQVVVAAQGIDSWAGGEYKMCLLAGSALKLQHC